MWQPLPEKLKDLAYLLEATQQPAADHREVLDRFDLHKQSDDFSNYLSFIFASGNEYSELVRHTAALVLKNSILQAARSPRGTSGVLSDVPYVRAACLAMLQSPIRPLRQAAGTLAAALLSFEPLEKWPELVQYMIHALGHQDAGTQEGTLTMIYKIAEDFPYQLQVDVLYTSEALAKPANVLMPHIAVLFSSSTSGDVRYHALRTFNKLVDLMPEWLLNNMDGYVTGLLSLANSESDARIHREICIGTNTLMKERPQALEPYLDSFILYILAAMQHAEHDVAIEATTFWILYLDCGLPVAHLAPKLPTIVELLLRHMVFEEHDEEVVAAQEAENGPVKDSDSDLRPFHSARGSGGSTGTPYTDTEDGSRSGQGSEDVPSEYTLRRSCAQTLDHVAVELRGALLPHVLPIVERYLKDSDWKLREAAILALGAIADGCAEGLRSHVPEILRLLHNMTTDAQPNVRCNSCWALGRYAAFRVQDASEEHADQAGAELTQIIRSLLERSQEKNVVVHHAALSALSCIHEDIKHYRVGGIIEHDVGNTLHALVSWMPHYTRKNLRQAFETLIQVVTSVPICMEDRELIKIYMSPLVQRLGGSPPLNVEVMPLIDTIIHLSLALGSNVEPYALDLLRHTLATAGANLEAVQSAEAAEKQRAHHVGGPGLNNGNVYPSPPQESTMFALPIVTYTLDLIAALIEVLTRSSDALLSAVGYEAVPRLVLTCAKCANACVQQSAFALIGELANQVPAVVARCHGDAMLRLCYEMLEPDRIVEPYISAINNACWALGLLATALPADAVGPLVTHSAERLLHVLKASGGSIQRRLRENAAISLGRLATVQPGELSPHLSHFLGEWCITLATITDGPEKVYAFNGLLALLRLNLEAARSAFTSLCAAIASWSKPPPQLATNFSSLFKGLRSNLEAVDQWEAALSRVENETFTPRIRTKILHYAQ